MGRITGQRSRTDDVSWDHGWVHALPTLALERDERVPKDVVDQVVHRRLLELTPSPALALERRRPTDLLLEEVVDAGERETIRESATKLLV